ncbi:Anaphase-promoting complex subunit 1 [Toxocara canis]|uniref:Anaphase-promoting complex subunit 1 n=1 Tax=Toxocara canis TaxID=6265 RepID=A0A0B2VQC3_TOXCA|nr:Anaphase-promoting complex subunit 1 [Toxocara canis]
MYLRTGNETVAKRMRAPTTLSKLEKIRPDLLLLRTLCQSLIMWNQIEPSEMYVEELVPSVLRQYVSRFFEDELILVDEDASYLSTIVDLETIARSYLNIVAGACFAIAIRYASSFCRGAFETIMRYLSIVMPEGNPSDANMRLCHAAGPTVCAAVLNQLVYSLALMAGSGDLEVLRLCRVLRRRVVASNAQKDVALYSTQVAANTAIGLIMIGKGRYALATNDLSVAALVIAFFPVAPHSISDNRTYLQPLRFLWSLSAEERLIDVVDAQTEEPLAKAAVNILFKRSNMRYFDNINGPSPIILPQPSIIEKIIITCENYEGRSFHLRNRAHWEALKNILRTRHGSLPLTRIGKVRCEEKRSGDSNKGSDVVDSDLKNLSDAEFDEMEMENECRTTIDEMGESSNSSSSTHTLQQIEFEEQRKSDWTPSYADDVDRLINSFTSIFGTDDAHSFLQHYIKASFFLFLCFYCFIPLVILILLLQSRKSFLMAHLKKNFLILFTDIIEKDDTRFPRVQCREVTAFLERCERKRYEPTAIASHLAASVSCLP